MYLIDTNIFLEVLLARSRREVCKSFLREVVNGNREGVVTDFTIHSIIVVMDSLKKLEALKTFLSSLTAYKGLRMLPTSLSIEIEAVKQALSKGLDVDDAVQYSAALSANVECIVSYDKHFDGLEIPRKIPEELV